MTWSRIGWRNLGRNPKRTVFTALGLAVGFFAVVFIVGWSQGVMVELVESATSLVNGQIEIHDAEYRPDRSMYDTIGGREGTDIDALFRVIDADPAVTAAAPRVYAGGLVSSLSATSAGMFMGIDPVRELTLSRFLDPLVTGRMPEPGRNELLVGEEMARQLSVELGDEVVVVASGADGSMANDLFTLVGVFRTGLVELDATFAVMPLGDLQALVVLAPERIHEIAVATTDPWIADATAERLGAALPPTERAVEVVGWTTLNPAMVEYVALGDSMYFIIIIVVFSIAIFGVANTMVMATYERRREFAVMLALGATPGSVRAVVLYEAMALGVLSLALGATITFPLMVWFHNAPPDMSWAIADVTLMGALLSPSLRVEYDPQFWLVAALALFATALLASLLPAWRAARIPPADTLSAL
ncbi:MAG: ABC transporter permease [Acidobacteria bacterium]|nr:ABC transporter permease [Acidobacteriota bacterium]